MSFPFQAFEPVWRYPDSPKVAEIITGLFGTPDSPWLPLYKPNEFPRVFPNVRLDLITSPLLGFAMVRKRVLESLADNQPAGTVECDIQGKVSIKLESSTTFPIFQDDDPLRPRPGTSMTLSSRDIVASKLEKLAGLPRFELHWPEAKRDETIARLTELLRHYGERFKPSETAIALYEEAAFYPVHARAILTFPALSHAATAEDLQAGRAIFTLGPSRAVRTWRLPRVPMVAQWTTLEIPDDDPDLGPQRPRDRSTVQHAHLQEGLVWQAEEEAEGTAWKRYYGFVGRHALARVPAKDVDFPASDTWKSGWMPFCRDLDGRMVPPGATTRVQASGRGLSWPTSR